MSRDPALQRAKSVGGRALGTAIALAGVDITTDCSRRSCLVLAPHPDDETLGCAAAIMRKLDAGTAVRVIVATDGSQWPPGPDPTGVAEMRRRELASACRSLGLADGSVNQLGFADSRLGEAGDDLVDAIADAVGEAQPSEVLTTSVADPHADHAALGRATLRALAGTSIPVLVYPIWQWGQPRALLRSLRAAPGRPRLVSTEGYLERKRRALTAYRSQLAPDAGGDQPDGLGALWLRPFFAAHEVFLPATSESRRALDERAALRIPGAR